jgi:hypothetical protein
MALVAYDEDLANRIRELIAGDPDVTEKKMFGGLAFPIGGKMSLAASGLMVRVDPQDTDALLTKSHERALRDAWTRAPGLVTSRR